MVSLESTFSDNISSSLIYCKHLDCCRWRLSARGAGNDTSEALRLSQGAGAAAPSAAVPLLSKGTGSRTPETPVILGAQVPCTGSPGTVCVGYPWMRNAKNWWNYLPSSDVPLGREAPPHLGALPRDHKTKWVWVAWGVDDSWHHNAGPDPTLGIKDIHWVVGNSAGWQSGYQFNLGITLPWIKETGIAWGHTSFHGPACIHLLVHAGVPRLSLLSWYQGSINGPPQLLSSKCPAHSVLSRNPKKQKPNTVRRHTHIHTHTHTHTQSKYLWF